MERPRDNDDGGLPMPSMLQELGLRAQLDQCADMNRGDSQGRNHGDESLDT